MFKKLVSNLPFSPQLLDKIGYYAKRLAKENATRRLAMVFAVLAFAVQLVAVIAPPESSVAASSNDLIYGGLGSNPKAALLSYYDSNGDFAGHTNLRGIFSYWGITRADLANTHVETITGGSSVYGQWYSMGRQPHAGDVKRIDIAGGPIYLRPLGVWGIGARHRALVGKRAVDNWPIAVLIDCGNLQVWLAKPPPPPKTPPPKIPPKTPPPPPTVAKPVPKKTVRNLSKPQNSKAYVDANNTTAKGGETLEYAVSLFNPGEVTISGYKMEDNIHDILEYADLVSSEGATVADEKLTWVVSIPPKQTVVKKFTIKIKNPVPSTPQSKSDPHSFDLCMDNVFLGQETRVCINKPVPKVVEHITRKTLPSTGAATDVIVGSVFIALAGYFFFRNRQLINELKIVQQQHNQGGSL